MQDRHYFQQVVELSEDCVKEVDFFGRVVAVNGFGLKLLKAPSEEAVVGKLWSSLWPEIARTAIEEAVQQAQQAQQAQQGQTTRLTLPCPDFAGEERWWRVTVSPFTDAQGTIRSVLAISRDITESRKTQNAAAVLNAALRQQLSILQSRQGNDKEGVETLAARLDRSSDQRVAMESAQQELQEQLDIAVAARAVAEMAARQAQKGEAVGQLVSGIAHDFNNMLHTCLASLSAVLDRPDHLDERQRKYLGYALSAAERAGRVSKRLLAFSRIHSYHAEPMNLSDVVMDMIPFLGHSLGMGMRIHLQESPEKLCVVADIHSVEQSLMNLCINARDACEGTGEIEVSFGTSRVADDDTHLERRAGHYHYMQVKDSGAGMSEEVRARIFEPFFTTKPEDKGTGLGLAQIYGYMLKTGGFIEVQSTLGVGTAFRLFFPATHGI